MLRPYQQQLVDDIRYASRQYRRVLAVLPTGGGKTQVFCHIAHNARTRGRSVLILVHRRELLDQARSRLRAMGVTGVNVETIQAWRGRPHDLVIVDEAHHATARTWRAKLSTCDGLILGFTATPQRLDGKGLDAMFDAMVEGPSTSELIADGYLSRYRLFCPPGKADLQGIKKRAGDYARGELEARVDQRRVLAAAVRNYKLYAAGRRAIGFCVSIAHMEHVRDTFIEAGINAVCVDGSMGRRERDNAIGAFRRGGVQVLLSVDLISEGFDVPACDCVLLMRPTASLGLHLQQIGRGLRPGERECVVLDCAGNSEVHGLPDESRLWSLTGEIKERKGGVAPVAVRVCKQCFSVHRPAPACPYCGFAHPTSDRILPEADVVLVDRTTELKARRREVGAARDRAALEAIAHQRGYKRGWVEKVLEARTLRAIK